MNTTLTTADICAAIAATGADAPKRPNSKEVAIKALITCMAAITGTPENGAKAAAAILACASRDHAADAARSIKAQADAPALAAAKPAMRKTALAVIEAEAPAPVSAPKMPRARKPEDHNNTNAKPGKRAAILEAAQRGELPPAPDFSAETHKRFRAKLAQIVAAAEAGDIDALRTFTINPVSSSPKAMAKYRDLAVIALEARVQGVAA